jgi:hypothetical protein
MIAINADTKAVLTFISIRPYALPGLRQMPALTYHRGHARAVAFSPTVSIDKIAITVPNTGSGLLQRAAMRANRRYLATGGEDGRIAIWALDT